MTRLPNFVTFTGVDDSTAISEMLQLSLVYPVEFGVLLSRKRQGVDPRYPGIHKAFSLLTCGARMAAHVCGDYVREILDGFDDTALQIPGARRVQINHSHPNLAAAQRFGQMIGRRIILQSRDETTFPLAHDVDWLFDRSGGRGASIGPIPIPYGEPRLVGYAGGLGPQNVADFIASLNKVQAKPAPYWLDMESGVRDSNNSFSMQKAWQVCINIWGDRRP